MPQLVGSSSCPAPQLDNSIERLRLCSGGQAILGNDVPSNSRSFSIIMLMVGAVLVATIFGNMTVLLANADAQTRAHYEKLERVKQSLVRMEVTPKLQSRVIKYYEYMWRRQKSGTDGQQGNFVTELPMALKAEVQLHLHEQLVLKVPFFNGCDRCETIHGLILWVIKLRFRY